MRRLTLSESIEVVTAVAIVLSLIFVGLEVRQNTNQLRAASLEAGLLFIRSVNDMMVSEETADVALRGLADFDSLSRVEKARFDGILANVSTNLTVAQDLYRRGLLPAEEIENYEEMWARILLSPGARRWHELTKHTYPPHLEAEFDRIIAGNEGIETWLEYYDFEPGGR